MKKGSFEQRVMISDTIISQGRDRVLFISPFPYVNCPFQQFVLSFILFPFFFQISVDILLNVTLMAGIRSSFMLLSSTSSYSFSFISYQVRVRSRQPLVSDCDQYDITVRAIRTDITLKGCIGDGLHLSEPYRSQSLAIGPDYSEDIMTYCKRKGWKDSFSKEECT